MLPSTKDISVPRLIRLSFMRATTVPDLCLTGNYFVDEQSAMGQQPTPTQPSITPESVTEQ